MAIRGSSLAGLIIPVGGPAGLPGQKGADGKDSPFQTINGYTGTNPTLDDIGALAKTGDASTVRALPNGALSASSLADLFADFARPENYRAPSDPDDSLSFKRALAQKQIVRCTPGRNYIIREIDLSNSQVIDAAGCNLIAAPGSAYMFRLLDYKPELRNPYISDASGATIAVIIGPSVNARIKNGTIIGAQTAVALIATGSPRRAQVERPIIDSLLIDTFSVAGLTYGANVSELNAQRVYVDAGAVFGSNGLGKPKPNTCGIKGVSTGTSTTPGGHLFVNCTTINSQVGWSFTDAQLVKIVNSIADGHSGYAFEVLGASQYIDATGLIVGTSGGVHVGGTSLGISLAHLRTIFTGIIPPWGGSDFFVAPGPYYDLTVDGTARVTVDAASWAGSKSMSVATGASLLLPGALTIPFQTVAAPAQGATTYIGQQGASTNPGPGWVVPYNAIITDAIIYTQNVPGSGQGYTYTLMVNGSVVATLFTSSGASSFGGHPRGINVAVNEGDTITLGITLSASATATQHRGFIRLLPAQ